MAAQLQFFDMSVSTTPPNGHLEPLPITLGPNWQPNDIRMVFVSGSGTSSSATLMMSMNPNTPTGFTAAYSLNPTRETHGVFYRRLQTGDTDTSVSWAKPSGWRHFMLATLTVRGVSPVANPSAGSMAVTYTTGDSTGTSATVGSVAVPASGSMVFFIGNVPTPEQSTWPGWAVAMGVPTGWTHLVATDKCGANFFQYDTTPGLMVAGKSFSSAGTTGVVTFPTAHGTPAFASLYAYLPPAQDVSMAIGAV